MTTDDARLELRGAMTALVTPFREGEVDDAALADLVERQIDAGTDWLVPCGTTGESPTLSRAEQDEIISLVVKQARGRCGVLAGTGSNHTAEAVRKTQRAAELGADAAMLVAPYYNRPTQEGLFLHYAAVADAVDLPIVLYNVPARTGVSIGNDVIVRLRERFPQTAAVKDATGDLDQLTDLLGRSDIAVLCGDDTLTWPMMALGAVGVVSVISNLDPSLMKSLVEAAGRGDGPEALRLHRKMYNLAKGIGRFGPNPLPIKTALAIRGLIGEEFRLPLCPVGGEARLEIERVLRRHEFMEPAAR